MSSPTFAEDRYGTMPYRRCGRSGLKLPAVSLGFWQVLGEPQNEDLCRRCMYHAFDHGITHFDLANNYGPPPGSSERVAGKILRDMPRDELIISTKAGYLMWPGPYGEWGSKKYLVASLDQSLKRLGLDYVDIFYHHRPDPDTPLEETMAALDLIVKQGKALYAGVSNYGGQQFADACAVTADHDWTPITIHQPAYNMFRRNVETDLLPRTAAAGTGVIAFSVLGGGFLSGRYLNGLPDDSRYGRQGDRGRQWYEKQQAAGIWDKANRLNSLAEARGQTLSQLAITWVLRDERVTSALMGVSSVEQLTADIAAATAPPLTDEECRKIDDILA